MVKNRCSPPSYGIPPSPAVGPVPEQMLAVVQEIVSSGQGAMSDLKQATANTKDVAALNAQVTADLRQSITRLEAMDHMDLTDSQTERRKHG